MWLLALNLRKEHLDKLRHALDILQAENLVEKTIQ